MNSFNIFNLIKHSPSIKNYSLEYLVSVMTLVIFFNVVSIKLNKNVLNFK
jgi:hypothetical protein